MPSVWGCGCGYGSVPVLLPVRSFVVPEGLKTGQQEGMKIIRNKGAIKREEGEKESEGDREQ